MEIAKFTKNVYIRVREQNLFHTFEDDSLVFHVVITQSYFICLLTSYKGRVEGKTENRIK